MRKTITLAFFLLMAGGFLSAQDVEFTVAAPDKVIIGETFMVKYTINKKAENFNAKPFEGLKQIAGPNSSSSSSMTIINGQMLQDYQKDYTYTIKAIAKGKFKIPEAFIIVEGKEYVSNTLPIEVIDSSSIQNIDTTHFIAKDDLLLELSFSKKEVYTQEAVKATIKLYTKFDIGSLTELHLPIFDDCIIYQSRDSIIQSFKDTINGNVRNYYTLATILLYPQKIGPLKVAGGNLTCKVLKPKRKKEYKKHDLSIFFDKPYTEIEQSLDIIKPNLMVKQLPKNQPSNFSHICGSEIKLNASINKASIDVYTPFIYQITLSGKGNLKLVNKPRLNLPAGFDEVTSNKISTIENQSDGSSGSITYSITIVPTQAGSFTIPSYSLSYFDLTNNQYITVSSEPLQIEVNNVNAKPSELEASAKPLSPPARVTSDMIVLFDISGTMLAQDFSPNRMEASINAAKKFIPKQKGNVGLIVFSESSKVISPLTSNLKAVRDSLGKIPSMQLGLATAMGLGLGQAISELQKSTSANQSIVLITDGHSNSGSITPLLAAQIAKCFGIRVYPIGIGCQDSLVPYPNRVGDTIIMSYLPIDIDEAKLAEIAEKTNGKYFRATNNGSFDAIFREITLLVNNRVEDNSPNEIPKEDAQRILNVISDEFENPTKAFLK